MADLWGLGVGVFFAFPGVWKSAVKGGEKTCHWGGSKTVPPGWCLTAPRPGRWGGAPRLDAVAGLGIGRTLNGIRPIRR